MMPSDVKNPTLRVITALQASCIHLKNMTSAEQMTKKFPEFDFIDSTWKRTVSDDAGNMKSAAVEELDVALGMVARNELRVLPVPFESEAVAVFTEVNCSYGWSIRSKGVQFPCWINEASIGRIESTPGAWICFIELWDDTDGRFVNAIYKSNLRLEQSDYSPEDMGMMIICRVFDSVTDLLDFLSGLSYLALFNEVQVRHITSLYHAAKSGALPSVPAAILQNTGELGPWHLTPGPLSETPLHWAAVAGHLPLVPAKLLTAFNLLDTGPVSTEFGLLHMDKLHAKYECHGIEGCEEQAQEMLEKARYGFYDVDAQGEKILNLLKLICGCPIQLAVIHEQTDFIVRTILAIPAVEWVKVNSCVHSALAEIAAQTGIAPAIQSLLDEIKAHPPLPTDPLDAGLDF